MQRDRGKVIHYDSASWSEMASGNTKYLGGVWGSGPSDVFAVGNHGTVIYYNGSR